MLVSRVSNQGERYYLFLNKKYLEYLLKKFGMVWCKAIATLINRNEKLK